MGKREIIAEDLGYMSETVRQLVRDSGFPGMKVLEFAFDSRDTGSASDYLPHNYPVNSVAYTGTHDNETLVSWYQTVTDAERAIPDPGRRADDRGQHRNGCHSGQRDYLATTMPPGGAA